MRTLRLGGLGPLKAAYGIGVADQLLRPAKAPY